MHRDSTTQRIGTLSIDLKKIPEGVKRAARVRRMGNHQYYCLKGAIEAVYGSAEITYTAKLGGKKFLVITRMAVANPCLNRHYTRYDQRAV